MKKHQTTLSDEEIERGYPPVCAQGNELPRISTGRLKIYMPSVFPLYHQRDYR
ncbi:hypothetical protein KCP69_10970 [Salmonella enterica subsp. enterica]|nr:hypothetical protein KCP69_10970 [Salmonella enterica subsp. enterica]